jgi:hypothetical protein
VADKPVAGEGKAALAARDPGMPEFVEGQASGRLEARAAYGRQVSWFQALRERLGLGLRA